MKYTILFLSILLVSITDTYQLPWKILMHMIVQKV